MSPQAQATIARYVEPIARAWLAAGANALSLSLGGARVEQWPRHAPMTDDGLAVPIQSGRTAIGELRVHGVADAGAAARLAADAATVARLLDLESQLDRMTVELANYQDQLVAVFDLARAARRRIGVDEVMSTVVDETYSLLQATRAFAVLAIDGQDRVFHAPSDADGADPMLTELSEWVRRAGRALVLNASDVPPAGLALPPDRGGVLAVPVRIDGDACAMLGAFRPAGEPFTAGSRALLDAIADHASTLIAQAFALQAALKQQRLQRDLELASTVQRTLVARAIPTLPGLEIAARYRPAAEIGGDLYGLYVRPDGQLVTAVADVTGKGVPAALVMSMMRTAIQGVIGFVPDPAQALNRINGDLYDDLSELAMFATAFLAYFDPDSRALEIASCGHSPVVFCPVGEPARLIEAGGPPLGVLEGEVVEAETLALGFEDLLIVATDGVSEAMDATGALFGYERLLELADRLRRRTADEIADAVLAEVAAFATGVAQADDQALVVLKGAAA